MLAGERGGNERGKKRLCIHIQAYLSAQTRGRTAINTRKWIVGVQFEHLWTRSLLTSVDKAAIELFSQVFHKSKQEKSQHSALCNKISRYATSYSTKGERKFIPTADPLL